MIGYYIFKSIFLRKKQTENMEKRSSDEYIMGPDYDDYIKYQRKRLAEVKEIPFERISVVSEDGLKLSALYYKNKDSKKTAILMHGYGSNGYFGAVAAGKEFIEKGYNILAPDNRACGESEGKYICFGIRESDDLLLWIDKILSMDKDQSIVLFGNSMGASTVCLASCKVPSAVKAIISDCAYSDMKQQLLKGVKERVNFLPGFLLDLSELWFKYFTGCSFSEGNVARAVADSKCPIFFAHGTEDRYVLPINARILFHSCIADTRLLYIENAGHSSCPRVGKEKYFRQIFSFIEDCFEIDCN